MAHDRESHLPEAPTAPPKQTYRSFKKKFAKLKIKFEVGIRENEALIREELRIEDLSKRIQEQNDQLLEVLLEFNDSLYLPSHLRYQLSAPGDPAYLPLKAREGYQDVAQMERAKFALEDARQSLSLGIGNPEVYQALEQSVRASNLFTPHTDYTSLCRIPHSKPRPEARQDPNDDFNTKFGYLASEHETEYLLALDAKLGDDAAMLQLSRAPEKLSLADREKEATLRNPVSVSNWLRRHQPQIFLQDNEIASEKSGPRPANLRSSKRASTQAQPQKEEDLYDEDGIALDIGPTPKNKRKRDEDTGYRPKGGSNRPKKKKDDASKRSSKRSSAVGA